MAGCPEGEGRKFREVQERAERFQGIFENSTLGIFQSSLDGRFLVVNKAFANIFGYTGPDELLKSIRDIENQFYLHPERRSEVLSAIEKKDGICKFEDELRRKDGSLVICSINIRAVHNSSGVITHLDGFVEDVTEARLREQKLREKSENLTKENLQLRSFLKDRYRFGEIIGKSAAMQEVYESILHASGSDTTVIVYGESGTGKELVARAVHELSKRKSKEFVPVNCGAIPEQLLESEFFGHKRGAFTGAVMDSRGYLDRANGGTLFLDEVGELRRDMQVKLLRAIESGTYYQVGDSRPRTSDFRLISATNRNLQELVQSGRMREDFFFRIDILPIDLPPLRERREDIPLLVDHYIRKFTKGETLPHMLGRDLEALYGYDYPGNVRELQNVLRRYLASGKLDSLRHGHESRDESSPRGSLPEKLSSYEKDIIKNCLIENRWHRERTAAALGIDRKTLYSRIKAYGLNFPKTGAASLKKNS